MHRFTENVTRNLERRYKKNNPINLVPNKSDFRITDQKTFKMAVFFNKWDRRVCKTDNQVTVALNAKKSLCTLEALRYRQHYILLNIFKIKAHVKWF